MKETAKIKLRERYTNSLNGTMICQLCHNPMPFKDKEDKDFFVTRQLFAKDIFGKESDENYIALCPTCYAKCNVYFTQQDEEKQKSLLSAIISILQSCVSLTLVSWTLRGTLSFVLIFLFRRISKDFFLLTTELSIQNCLMLAVLKRIMPAPFD